MIDNKNTIIEKKEPEVIFCIEKYYKDNKNKKMDLSKMKLIILNIKWK